MLFNMCVSLIPKDKFLEAESWVKGHTLCKCFWYPVPNHPVWILGLFIHSLSSVWLLICMFQNEVLIFLRSCFMALVNLSVEFFNESISKLDVWLVNIIWNSLHTTFLQHFCTALINQFYCYWKTVGKTLKCLPPGFLCV